MHICIITKLYIVFALFCSSSILLTFKVIFTSHNYIFGILAKLHYKWEFESLLWWCWNLASDELVLSSMRFSLIDSWLTTL